MSFIMTYPHHNNRLQSSKTNRLRMPWLQQDCVCFFYYQIKVQSNFELKSQGSILPLLVRLVVISFICGQWSSTSMPERAPHPNSISPSRHQLEKRRRERWWEGGGKAGLRVIERERGARLDGDTLLIIMAGLWLFSNSAQWGKKVCCCSRKGWALIYR